MKNKKILAILPVSIGGRLTTSSLIDGFRQNGCKVTVYDELKDSNLNEVLEKKYDAIAGYDFSPLKIKVDNKLRCPSINYFSDDIRSKASGPEWEKYLPYLEDDDNYVFYWDKVLTDYENFKNIYYLPHFPELKIAWYAIDRHYEDALKRAQFPELIDLCYQGFIDNEEDMAKAINNTKIVFNMNSQGISSLNYRTFQTVACKRLMISDYRDELALFEGHMPFYEDFSDLIFKIESYLEDKEAYNRVVEECYRIARQSHNSKDCTRYILKTLSRTLSRVS